MLENVNPQDIQVYIRGVIYPTTKQEMLDRARENNAPEQVVRIIERLPGDTFEDYSEIMRAFGEGSQGNE